MKFSSRTSTPMNERAKASDMNGIRSPVRALMPSERNCATWADGADPCPSTPPVVGMD